MVDESRGVGGGPTSAPGSGFRSVALAAWDFVLLAKYCVGARGLEEGSERLVAVGELYRWSMVIFY